MNYRKFVGCGVAALVWLLTTVILTGCKTSSEDHALSDGPAMTASGGGTDAPPANVSSGSSELIHIGDSLVIAFSDTSNPIPAFEERVNDQGNITLIENQTFTAVGKTRAELEKEIHDRYVPKFYVKLTVNIKPQDRFFFVDGEVKNPGRHPYVGRMTVTKAIASAGYFTEFAKKTKVRIIRVNGKKETINCPKAEQEPSLDLPVYPGDSIHVPRRIF